MSHFTPVKSVKYFTPGTLVVLALALLGWGMGLFRMVVGLESVTNLDDQYPWGIWIAIDVATGVALAAGGFTTAALAHIFHKEKFHSVTRAALLTAMLGYTFVAIGLLFDLGRWYNVWHPLVYWQGNSVLFEVGICVMTYLTVLYLEFVPIVSERFQKGVQFWKPFRFLEKPARVVVFGLNRLASPLMSLLIIAGVVLSCMHQSSLGALMVIAPTKVHPLWYSPILPLMFLSSAIAVGFPMVIVEAVIAHRSFRLPQETKILSALSRYIPVILGIYMAMKIGDLLIRDAWVHLLTISTQSIMWMVEVGLGIVTPFVLLLLPWTRRSAGRLFLPAAMIVGGVMLNRINVFLVSYTPPYADWSYFPTLLEISVTVGLICTIMLLYRFAALTLPIVEAEEGGAS